MGTGAVRTSGISACHTASRNASAMSSWPTTTSLCCVPNVCAISRWNGRSSNSASSKASEKVRRSVSEWRRASAAMAEESRPPLRYEPRVRPRAAAGGRRPPAVRAVLPRRHLRRLPLPADPPAVATASTRRDAWRQRRLTKVHDHHPVRPVEAAGCQRTPCRSGPTGSQKANTSPSAAMSSASGRPAAFKALICRGEHQPMAVAAVVQGADAGVRVARQHQDVVVHAARSCNAMANCPSR